MSEPSKPFFVAVIGALSGAAVAAVITGFSNRGVERDKFNYQIVQSALDSSDVKERAERLKFILDSGLIDDRTLEQKLQAKLTESTEKPAVLPQLPPPPAPVAVAKPTPTPRKSLEGGSQRER